MKDWTHTKIVRGRVNTVIAETAMHSAAIDALRFVAIGDADNANMYAFEAAHWAALIARDGLPVR